MSKFIIGGGISGLVWNFYHPEFKIITPDLGGTYGRSYMVWLHDTYETRKLLKDLGFPIKTKKSYIGYYHQGWIAENLSTDMNLVMIQKKMTEWNKPIDKNFIPKTRDLSLSGGFNSTNYMNTLDVDLVEVIKRLSEKATIEAGFVIKIDDKNIITKENFSPTSTEKVREYEKIVSTIAAPFFWKAFGKTKEFKCLPITNIVTSVKPKEFDGRFEMIYYDDSVPFSRISHLGDTYALEFTGEITKDEFIKQYPDLPILDYFIVKQGRIFENDENSPPDNIIFSGRFAQWKYGIVTENIISQALEYKE